MSQKIPDPCMICHADTNSYVLLILEKLVTRLMYADSCMIRHAGTNSYVLFTLEKLVTRLVYADSWMVCHAGTNSYVLFTLEKLVTRLMYAELYMVCHAGTNSYVLFTLEKLVTRLMKHLQQMLAEDVSCKLLDLWKYESARGVGYTDAVNYANAHVILHDDTCFRFEARKDDHLTIQQLFVDKSEVAGGEHSDSPHARIHGVGNRAIVMSRKDDHIATSRFV